MQQPLPLRLLPKPHQKELCTAFNYISAEAAELGPMNYADFADGSPFPKECERRTRLPPDPRSPTS